MESDGLGSSKSSQGFAAASRICLIHAIFRIRMRRFRRQPVRCELAEMELAALVLASLGRGWTRAGLDTHTVQGSRSKIPDAL